MSDPTSIPLLRRGAILRYRRLLGLPRVEYGIVAVLGRRKPITIAALPELLGMEQSAAQSSTFDPFGGIDPPRRRNAACRTESG
jgi:hypothetical protein